MKQKVVETIRTKSRDQWAETAIERWTELRIWLQEHGELALLIGFGLGILAVVAYPLMLVLILVFAVLAAVVWFVAEPVDGPLDGSGRSVDSVSITRETTVSSASPVHDSIARPSSSYAAGEDLAGPLASESRSIETVERTTSVVDGNLNDSQNTEPGLGDKHTHDQFNDKDRS